MHEEPFRIHLVERVVYDGAGRRFDPRTHAWVATGDAARGKAADLLGTATWLQRDSGYARRQPVAVLGAPQPSADERFTAAALGRALARLHLPVLLVDDGEIARAAAKGADDADGLVVSLTTEARAAEGARLVLPADEYVGALLSRVALCAVTIGAVAIAAPLPTTFAIELDPRMEHGPRGAPLDAVLDGIARTLLELPSD